MSASHPTLIEIINRNFIQSVFFFIIISMIKLIKIIIIKKIFIVTMQPILLPKIFLFALVRIVVILFVSNRSLPILKR